MDLKELLTLPTALCCMEMQRGVVGDLSTVAATTAAVRESGIVSGIARLVTAARTRATPVVHCTAAFRPDGVGTFPNMAMIEAFRHQGAHLLTGTPSVEVIPELFDPAHDIVSERHHGISPFAGTSLDTVLRSQEIRTVIATGVSLNRGVLGMTIEAIGRGYHVVVPRDGAAGYPADYGDAVLRHSLDGIATITTVDDILAAWGTP